MFQISFMRIITLKYSKNLWQKFTKKQYNFKFAYLKNKNKNVHAVSTSMYHWNAKFHECKLIIIKYYIHRITV